MAVYLTLTAAVAMLALLVREEKMPLMNQGVTRQQLVNRVSCLFIFCLLFAVSALRLNVGNDYLKYVEFMHLVFSRAYVPTEIGFNALSYAVYYLCGFENYLLVFAIFSFATIYFFMKGIYDQSRWFTLSFVLFMLLGLYFQSLSTVRYYLALSMALYSVTFVIKKDWPRFILLVLLGSLFHKSLLVILVLYFLAQLKWKRWMYGLLFAGGVSCLFLKNIYLKIVIFLYPSYKDTEYLEGGTSYATILRCAIVLGFAIWLYKEEIEGDRAMEFFFICNLMALVLYVFGSFLPIISRIGYYLTVTHILFVPNLIVRMKDVRKRQVAIVATLLFGIGYFALYMRGAANDGVRILPYQTFLFHDLPLTLSERGYY
ncbi:MAG: EpsG family protein [Butyrivibrio sp.]|nr:EpsG family protein [Butyrivibrio sp.]